MANVRVLQAGAVKPGGVWPYTLCIVANPWIESGRSTNPFIRDPIMVAGKEPEFDAAALYIIDCIAGRLAGQAEKMFGPMMVDWRIVTIYDTSLPDKRRNALVAHDNTQMVMPNQKRFPPFLKSYTIPGMGKLRADVAFGVTASATHDRCSAQPTLDDNGGPGRRYSLDGRQMTHRTENKLPGTVAFHVTARSLVPLHEFSHAASSQKNGKIIDLYRDGKGFNRRSPRPVPQVFCVYNNQSFAAAPDRGGGLPYPPNSNYFHPELADPAFPALMDNYTLAGGQVRKCRHDKLTRQFLTDRVQAIMDR